VLRTRGVVGESAANEDGIAGLEVVARRRVAVIPVVGRVACLAFEATQVLCFPLILLSVFQLIL
jgi:hypothetical protein